MRIKSVDISGFKSFCDHTRILFDSGLTSVVGPNGCGKSNIVDAIRWALGEQSARLLRGKGMEDVIFNGSETRKPQSLADVTITFHNDDGLSHPDYVEYPEISVTRRLHRDGFSEYLINKTPCRLRDVTDLFLGTGGGARAYSIIEQGRIGLIVSSRSEDRRTMIEEAAGITRYKAARKNASRKMEQTRQHLLRVGDVVAEMERSLSSLKRQARKAERFKRYRSEQRDLELHIASHRYLEQRSRAAAIGAELAEREEEHEKQRGELASVEAEVEQRRVDEQRDRGELDEAKAAAFELDSDLQRIESEMTHLRDTRQRLAREQETLGEQEGDARQQLVSLDEESGELSERLAEIEHSSGELEERRVALDERLTAARERLAELGSTYDEKRDAVSRSRARIAASQNAAENLDARVSEIEERLRTSGLARGDLEGGIRALEEQVAGLTEKSGEMEGSLRAAAGTVDAESRAFEELRRELDACDSERAAVRDELQSKASRLASLEEMHEGLDRHDRAVREAVSALRETEDGPRHEGLLVDFLQCPERYEVALAAALGDRLQALVVEDHRRGLELLEWLAARDLGRVTAIARSDERRAVAPPRPDELPGAERLLDEIRVRPELVAAAERLLGDVRIAADADEALRLWNDSGRSLSMVTLDGQLLGADGAMRGGRAGSPGADLLGQNREIRRLGEQVERLRSRHESLEERFGEIKAELIRRRDAADRARGEVQQHEIRLAETRKDRARALDELAGERQRLEMLDREIAQQREMLDGARADRERVIAEIGAAREDIERLERALAEDRRAIEICREEVDGLSAEAADVRVRAAGFEQQHRAAVERSGRIAETRAQLAERLSRSGSRRVDNAAEEGRAAGRLVVLGERLAERLDAVERQRRAVEAARQALDRTGEALAEAEASLKRRRERTDETAERVARMKMGAREIVLETEHLVENAAELYDVDLLQVLGDYHMRPGPDERARLRIEELKRLIDRMGAINPMAIEEYEETQFRHAEKVEHKQDVEQALEDLERAIKRMDGDSRRMFKETFEAVNERFREIFPRLFKGGQARLLLSDPDDLLATGVEIVAQPPGKRLGHIELMSGGEKALTAVSLLFALFLHRPSPFCLLDEVDAPLDEANVGRFVELLREMTDRSQFILITHSKVTMESTDALYGVTMQEPGISKMVSVRLVSDAEQRAAASA